MKVLHINCNYVGTALHRTTIRFLREEGGEHFVFAPTDGRREWESFQPQAGEIVKKCFRKIDRYLFFLKQAKIRRNVERAYNIASFDCLHAYTVFTDGNTAMRLAEKYKKPFVVAVRNTDVNGFFKYRVLLRPLGVKILLRAKAVFFLSETYRTTLLQKYIPKRYRQKILEKSRVVPNGIDPFWLENVPPTRTAADETRVQNGGIRLLYVGTLVPRKKALTVAKAVEIMNRNGMHIQLTVVGKPIDMDILNALKCSPDVIDHAACPKEELIRFYRENDIFVMPSRDETFGLVYAEAMSQGLPVIYGVGEGFDGQFPDGTVGFPAEPDSPEDVAEKIQKIADDYGQIAGRCPALAERFDWKKIVREYISVYKKFI